jgi:hypothetical protein
MTISGFRGFVLSNVEGSYALDSPISDELSSGLSPSGLWPGPHDRAHETAALYFSFRRGFGFLMPKIMPFGSDPPIPDALQLP